MRGRRSPLANVPILARTREEHDGCHAGNPQHQRTRGLARLRCAGPAAQRHRTAAGGCEVQADQDRGAELRDRAPQALALRVFQRELGQQRPDRAVRSDRDRHARGRRRSCCCQPGTASHPAGAACCATPCRAQTLPGRPAAHRSPPRNPGHPLRLWPSLQARRRRNQRAARLRVLPDDPGRAHARADHRQRHSRPRPAGPGGHRQARRPELSNNRPLYPQEEIYQR